MAKICKGESFHEIETPAGAFTFTASYMTWLLQSKVTTKFRKKVSPRMQRDWESAIEETATVQESPSPKTQPSGGIVNVVQSSWKERDCIDETMSEHGQETVQQQPSTLEHRTPGTPSIAFSNWEYAVSEIIRKLEPVSMMAFGVLVSDCPKITDLFRSTVHHYLFGLSNLSS